MSIDPSGMAHVMSILTNLYADAPLAVLREYATNARDSHVAAGTDRPIEVDLPSDLNPTLVIRDFGVGLSEAEIIDVYARYGASTKRDTNDQVGAFGLGLQVGVHARAAVRGHGGQGRTADGGAVRVGR